MTVSDSSITDYDQSYNSCSEDDTEMLKSHANYFPFASNKYRNIYLNEMWYTLNLAFEEEYLVRK